MAVTKEIEVLFHVNVTVDEAKFTPEFMTEFRKSFYRLYTLDQHLEHLAQMYARGIVHDRSFIEGYGQAAEMGIKFQDVSCIAMTADSLNEDL